MLVIATYYRARTPFRCYWRIGFALYEQASEHIGRMRVRQICAILSLAKSILQV